MTGPDKKQRDEIEIGVIVLAVGGALLCAMIAGDPALGLRFGLLALVPLPVFCMVKAIRWGPYLWTRLRAWMRKYGKEWEEAIRDNDS